jgi:hypothetical protein
MIDQKKLSEKDGGEVEAFIKKYKGMRFHCYGTHKKGIPMTHEANTFFGYEHSDGLADKNGKRWWVYVYCTEDDYATSFVKLPFLLDKKSEREILARH